jgi:hypothetical protein
MHTKSLALAGLFLLTHSPLGAAASTVSPLYRLGTRPPQLLFTLESRREADGWTDHYRDAQGADAVIERLWFKDGRTQRYEYDDRQEGGVGSLQRSGDRVVLRWDQDGKTQQKTVDAPKTLICGPSYVGLLQERWNDLLKGEKIVGTVPVLSRSRLMLADLAFRRRSDLDRGDGSLHVEMKPANWFVALFFPAIGLDFDPQSRRLLHVAGRSLLKERVKGEWKMTDVDLTYAEPR